MFLSLSLSLSTHHDCVFSFLIEMLPPRSWTARFVRFLKFVALLCVRLRTGLINVVKLLTYLVAILVHATEKKVSGFPTCLSLLFQ
jgi:hypothetical protein